MEAARRAESKSAANRKPLTIYLTTRLVALPLIFLNSMITRVVTNGSTQLAYSSSLDKRAFCMKSLKGLWAPRTSVFDKSKRDVVLDITDLAEIKFDPDDFFAKSYQTDGMKRLLERLMKRGLTLIVAAHHPEDLPRGITHVLRLHKGRAYATDFQSAK